MSGWPRIGEELSELRSLVAAETLAPHPHQYLARCFELLQVELTAVRRHLTEMQ
jgi:hypothetical protein